MIAIEYPEQYRKEKNFFQAAALVKVTGQLRIHVNEYSSNSIQPDNGEQTHMFILPPNTLGHIRANLQTKLRLGYSVVSVYDRSTDTYRNEEATAPIVKLVNDNAI